jgi:peptidoglycan/xylan/chitin deacetylase (PgdA/CDA1 family)
MRHIILNFHGIGERPKEREPGESAFWISPGFYSEILDLLVQTKDMLRTEVTFDDGNASDILIGAEGLARHGMAATFFVLSDRMGTPECLSEQDLATLVEMGHRIGTHGAAHLDWTTLDAAGFERELDGARKVISAAAGRPVSAAAIPLGRYNRRVLSELRIRNYDMVYSSDGGPVLSPRLPLPRTSVRSDMTMDALETLLTGAEPVARQIRRRLARMKKRWL